MALYILSYDFKMKDALLRVRSHEDQNEEDQKFWLRFGTEKTDGFYCVEFHVSRAHVTAKRYQSLLVLGPNETKNVYEFVYFFIEMRKALMSLCA